MGGLLRRTHNNQRQHNNQWQHRNLDNGRKNVILVGAVQQINAQLYSHSHSGSIPTYEGNNPVVVVIPIQRH